MSCIKPGFFAYDYTDSKRDFFDKCNQLIIDKNIQVDTIFIGDSITEGIFLEKNLPTESILNRGIGGDRTNYMVERFIADCVQLKPKKAIILGGVNDL